VSDVSPSTVWDLYCGVGGFALHVATDDRDVVGIETSVEAIASARLSAAELGADRVHFDADDATSFALVRRAPDLVIVNPPRRGIGRALAEYLGRSSTKHVVYSSCNAESLARDLAVMPSLRPVRAQMLDMFPQTTHYEVLTLLERV
jgi:23S rRNA (uracil747-C5)-methyltransferase